MASDSARATSALAAVLLWAFNSLAEEGEMPAWHLTVPFQGTLGGCGGEVSTPVQRVATFAGAQAVVQKIELTYTDDASGIGGANRNYDVAALVHVRPEVSLDACSCKMEAWRVGRNRGYPDVMTFYAWHAFERRLAAISSAGDGTTAKGTGERLDFGEQGGMLYARVWMHSTDGRKMPLAKDMRLILDVRCPTMPGPVLESAQQSATGNLLRWKPSPAAEAGIQEIYGAASQDGPWSLLVSLADGATCEWNDAQPADKRAKWYRIVAKTKSGESGAPSNVLSAGVAAEQPTSGPSAASNDDQGKDREATRKNGATTPRGPEASREGDYFGLALCATALLIGAAASLGTGGRSRLVWALPVIFSLGAACLVATALVDGWSLPLVTGAACVAGVSAGGFIRSRRVRPATEVSIRPTGVAHAATADGLVAVASEHGQVPFAKGERPSERLKARGAEALSTSELLAVLIASGPDEHDAYAQARELLYDAGSVKELATRSVAELSAQVEDERTSLKLKAALALAERVVTDPLGPGMQFKGPDDVFMHCHPKMMTLKKERFMALCLDSKNRFMSEHMVSEGVLSATPVTARDVFGPAMKASASGVILVHNHPSGDPEPSSDDIELTVQLQRAGESMGIKVLDHVIVGDKTFTSLKETGFMI